MSTLGYIETWGSGIARIKEICSENHIDFSIKETGDFVQVTFVRPQENARKKVDEEQIIINYIKKHGKIQRSNVMEILHCGETKAKSILKKMTRKKLEKITKGKYTYYILKNKQ